MKNNNKEVDMPRPRKYNYQEDYPIRFFINVPVGLVNKLEKLGFSQTEMQKHVEQSKIVERFMEDFIEKNSKKD
ncbi:hypothetical protein [Bacillus sp. B1-b2]|uniref:hypothetical protein n=1 Tax=Bacillus sp. B1-b2 TaxID=2653201 RepID=UPI001261D3C4|nr:hypothetical protein [Bacillus sp. B1-b2]KAB7663032.1 hypothetical protein F9279_24365 [Bacillus sp. B1-b2]